MSSSCSSSPKRESTRKMRLALSLFWSSSLGPRRVVPLLMSYTLHNPSQNHHSFGGQRYCSIHPRAGASQLVLIPKVLPSIGILLANCLEKAKRSDDQCVEARFIAPRGGVGPTPSHSLTVSHRREAHQHPMRVNATFTFLVKLYKRVFQNNYARTTSFNLRFTLIARQAARRLSRAARHGRR